MLPLQSFFVFVFVFMFAFAFFFVFFFLVCLFSFFLFWLSWLRSWTRGNKRHSRSQEASFQPSCRKSWEYWQKSPRGYESVTRTYSQPRINLGSACPGVFKFFISTVQTFPLGFYEVDPSIEILYNLIFDLLCSVTWSGSYELDLSYSWFWFNLFRNHFI